jgi:hypothetical protein
MDGRTEYEEELMSRLQRYSYYLGITMAKPTLGFPTFTSLAES